MADPPAVRTALEAAGAVVTSWWPRFISKVDVQEGDGCWLWTAAFIPREGEDYGKFYLDGRLQYAHRVCYEAVRGPIPDGMQIDHLCRTPRCVNPDHLEVVTGRENRRRGTGFSGRQSRQELCIHGHRLSGSNLYRWRGHRFCRSCRKQRNREWRSRR